MLTFLRKAHVGKLERIKAFAGNSVHCFLVRVITVGESWHFHKLLPYPRPLYLISMNGVDSHVLVPFINCLYVMSRLPQPNM